MKVELLETWLKQSGYDHKETEYLVNGFRYGFDLQYEGPVNRTDQARNIPLDKNIGSDVDVWEKMMKEVALGRFAGPYDQVPFDTYVQSPIGLVPKSNGQSRLIFHLSYDFKDSRNQSINAHIPKQHAQSNTGTWISQYRPVSRY